MAAERRGDALRMDGALRGRGIGGKSFFMSSSAAKSRRRRVLLRLLVIVTLAAVVLGAVGATGYYFFTGWRARDLAAKAKENFEKANYRMAWLQINSAKELRGNDSEVLRVLGSIEGAMGRPGALDHYEKLSQQGNLTPEDLKTRAEIAMRSGDDAQFARAVEELEQSGQTREAGALRMSRQFRKGDIDRAIGEARAASGASEDPVMQLALAKSLVQRYRPEFGPGRSPSVQATAGLAEVVEIIDGLLDTPQRGEALAFALNDVVNTAPENRQRWAAAAMDEVQTENPALLSAAAVLVRSGQQTPQQLHAQLRPVFDAAPLDRRAAYALWLTGVGLSKEALTLVTAQEASESGAAFGARIEALFAMNNFEGVLATVEAGGNAPADLLLVAKARAEYARGRGVQGGAVALREAMDAAAKAQRLQLLLPTGDALGAGTVVDEKIAEMCGDPALADYVFRLARDRFSRRGRTSLLAASLERARAAVPQSPAVQDYLRYTALNGDGEVSLEETAAACAAEPANETFRITHALNLLENNRPDEAMKVFEDITIFADRLPPGQLAIIAAVLAASGDTDRARAAARAVDPALLTPGEYARILPLRAGGGADGE